MSVVREVETTYQAECDGCGARGPKRSTAADAIEAVTADTATARTGISLLGRWIRTPPEGPMNVAGVRCPACASGAQHSKSDPLVTVCAECLTASCWLGESMCMRAHSATTVQRRESELRALGREHPSYWDKLRRAERGES